MGLPASSGQRALVSLSARAVRLRKRLFKVAKANRARHVVETLCMVFVVRGVLTVVVPGCDLMAVAAVVVSLVAIAPRTCAGAPVRADVAFSCGRAFGCRKAKTVKGSDDDESH